MGFVVVDLRGRMQRLSIQHNTRRYFTTSRHFTKSKDIYQNANILVNTTFHVDKVGHTVVCFGNVMFSELFSVCCVCYCALTLRATILWTVWAKQSE